MRAAFKEWAIVVDALGRGEQILILRKGGISEGASGFAVERPSFLLFPTLFHQQRQSVVGHAQRRYDQIVSTLPSEDRLRIEFFAEVIEWHELISPEAARALRGQHIWRDEVIAERFDWGRSKNIYALALRVFRLAAPADLAMLPSYGGCKSWVELEEEISTTNAQPVLAAPLLEEKIREFRQAIGTAPRLSAEPS